ncbi:MAG: hypothetical protein ACYSUX_00365 [Planctomycetota bacterium]|jgi:hypothetical protein
MANVVNVTIDPKIELDEDRIKGMPDNIKQSLLITMTMAAQRYNCDWRDLSWSVKFPGGQPVISVKKKGDGND